MEESKQNQAINHQLAIWRHEVTTPADRGAEPPPPLITKKWLACRFDLMQESGHIDYKQLYTKVLTPEVIREMGSTVEEIRCKNLRKFTRQQTITLIRVLEL